MIKTIKKQARNLLSETKGSYQLFGAAFALSILSACLLIWLFSHLIPDWNSLNSRKTDWLLSLITIIPFFLSWSTAFSVLEVYRKEQTSLRLNALGLVFQKERFWPILLTRFVVQGLLLLWHLLAIIVAAALVLLLLMLGFGQLVTLVIGLFFLVLAYFFVTIKQLSYSQAIFVVYDQVKDKTYQGVLKAIKQSTSIMQQQKWPYVKLYLSFIGWYFLLFMVVGLTTTGFWWLNQHSQIGHQLLGTIFVAISLISTLPILLYLFTYLTTSRSLFYDKIKDKSQTTNIGKKQ